MQFYERWVYLWCERKERLCRRTAARTAVTVQMDWLPSAQDPCNPASLSSTSAKLVSDFTNLCLKEKKKSIAQTPQVVLLAYQ